MSLPSYSLVREEALDPLLPSASAAKRPGRKLGLFSLKMSVRSEADDDLSDLRPQVQVYNSFASEPFHRFDGPKQPQGAAQWQGARDNAADTGAAEDRFSGNVDANSDPELADFAQGEQMGPSQAQRAVTSVGSGGPLTNSTLSGGNIINLDPGDQVFYKDDQGRTKFEEAELYVREGELNDKFFNHPTGRWSKLAYKILHHPVFHVFDLLLSVALMLLALIEKPSVFGSQSDEQPLVSVHGVLELLILGLLGVDIILRFIWLSPHYFFRHRRTMFITVMLCVMVVEALVVLIRQESHFRITRALRPVFFIDTYLMFGVRRVLRQIFQSIKVIVDVILLLFFVVAFFALIAYYLFADADPAYFDTFGLSFVSLFITTTTANNPDVMMEAYGQYNAAPIFFLIYLVITIYFVNNILLAVVISNFSEEEKEKFRKLFLHKREALRHAYRVLAGPTGIMFDDFLTFMHHYRPRMPEWQVMCVFKALHLNPNNQHSELSESEFYAFYEVQNLKWREVTNEGEDVAWFERFTPPVKKVFSKIHAVVKWEWFNSIIYIVIIINMVFLVIYTAFITESDSQHRFKHLNIVLPISILFLLVYIVEITLKILALGPVQYFKKFWNICDFLVISVSLIAVCLELHPLYHSLAVIRPIKLIRIIRLKKRYRDIMNTLVVLTPRLVSVSFLLLVIYYFFAIIGMEVFHDRVYEGCCVNASYSVGHYYAGSVNSSAPDPAVYYLNNYNNILRSFVTLFILMVVNNWYIIMEGFASEVSPHWGARVYFFSFYIVTLVVLQVVISFIVEAFVLQLEQANHRKEKKKLLERSITVTCDTDCVEDEHRKKEVRITLHPEDVKKLNYLITFTDERRRRDGEAFSLDRKVKCMQRIDLPKSGMQCSGRRLRTKDDLHLLKYRADIEQWIQEQDKAFQQVENTSRSPPDKPLKKKVTTLLKKVLVYLLE